MRGVLCVLMKYKYFSSHVLLYFADEPSPTTCSGVHHEEGCRGAADFDFFQWVIDGWVTANDWVLEIVMNLSIVECVRGRKIDGKPVF